MLTRKNLVPRLICNRQLCNWLEVEIARPWEATSPRTLARAHPTSRTHYAMSAFAMTGAAAPAKIAAKYNLGRNSKALNAKGEYKWHPWI